MPNPATTVPVIGETLSSLKRVPIVRSVSRASSTSPRWADRNALAKNQSTLQSVQPASEATSSSTRECVVEAVQHREAHRRTGRAPQSNEARRFHGFEESGGSQLGLGGAFVGTLAHERTAEVEEENSRGRDPRTRMC